MRFFRRSTPEPTPEPPRGAHSDESARVKDVRHAGTWGIGRKARNGAPPRAFEHMPWDHEMEITPQESDARERRHPQLDVCWPTPLDGRFRDRRRGPV